MSKSIRFLAVLVLVGACSKGGAAGLSKDSVKEVREKISNDRLSYDDSVKLATDKFGAPSKVDGKKTFWAGKDGEKCFEFYLENYSGATATAVQSADCPK